MESSAQRVKSRTSLEPVKLVRLCVQQILDAVSAFEAFVQREVAALDQAEQDVEQISKELRELLELRSANRDAPLSAQQLFPELELMNRLKDAKEGMSVLKCEAAEAEQFISAWEAVSKQMVVLLRSCSSRGPAIIADFLTRLSHQARLDDA